MVSGITEIRIVLFQSNIWWRYRVQLALESWSILISNAWNYHKKQVYGSNLTIRFLKCLHTYVETKFVFCINCLPVSVDSYGLVVSIYDIPRVQAAFKTSLRLYTTPATSRRRFISCEELTTSIQFNAYEEKKMSPI